MVRLIKDCLIKFFEYSEEPYIKEEPKELNIMGKDNTTLKVLDIKIQTAIKSVSEETGFILPKDSEGNIFMNSGFLVYLAEWVINAKAINQELLKEKGANFENQSKQIAERIIEILKETKRNGN